MEPIGRDREVADVLGRIRSGRRLVTILGPGGIGKTTLARAAARQLGAASDERFVALATVERVDAVAGAVAAALGFASIDVAVESGELDGIVTIDNCEHVAEGAATVIEALLRRCPAVSVLATSRSPIGVDGESLVAVAPLHVPAPGVPDSSCPSVRLFCERALDAGVVVTEPELDLVGELCRRVDGVPLAIEVAAARLRTMSLGELLTRLADGIDVLQRPRHRGASRHRSVRDTIRWSIDLLDEADRVRLAGLAVGAGPFALRAVGRIVDLGADDASAFLERMVDASLVEVEHRPDEPARYRLLEPVRHAAVERLDERGHHEARERFTAAVHEWTAQELLDATTCWRAHLLHQIMSSFDQFATALHHCMAHDREPTRAHTFCMVLWGAVHQGRVDDVEALTGAVLERWPITRNGTGADAVATHAMARLLRGDLDEAEQAARAALPLSAGSWAAAIGLRRVLGLAARYRGDHERAEAMLHEAAVVAASQGAPTFEWECHTYRAQDLVALGRVEEAIDVVDHVASTAAARGSIINEIWARTVHAAALSAAPSATARADALRLARETLATAQRVRYPFGVSCNLQTAALCEVADGDVTAAAATAVRLIDVFSRAGAGDFRRSLDIAAVVLRHAGHPSADAVATFGRRLPDTNPMIVPLDPAVGNDPTIIDRASATALVRTALREIAASASSQPAPSSASSSAPSMVRAGDVWEVTFARRTVRVVASKGMDDLATLLARPAQDVHAVDLVGGAVEQPGTGDVIDATARRSYEVRVRELQAEVDDADAANDIGRAERARAELDVLVDHLAAALSVGGRARSTGSTSERARSAVTHRIRTAIDRLDGLHPALGRHLAASVRTGHYCSYRPETPVSWTVRT